MYKDCRLRNFSLLKLSAVPSNIIFESEKPRIMSALVNTLLLWGLNRTDPFPYL
jgi:hypothetical protein